MLYVGVVLIICAFQQTQPPRRTAKQGRGQAKTHDSFIHFNSAKPVPHFASYSKAVT